MNNFEQELDRFLKV